MPLTPSTFALGALMLLAAYWLNRRPGVDPWANPFTYERATLYLAWAGVGIKPLPDVGCPNVA